MDYGAALEMRFGATRRGFESRPLRHLRTPRGRPGVRWPIRSSLTHVEVRSLRSSGPPSPERPRGVLEPRSDSTPSTRAPITRSAVDSACRARRGTSGALYLQSAPAGLNSLPRSPFSRAAASSDVEDRVPRSGESRTVSGPEGSSTKRTSSGAAERPGPSRSSRWARERPGRRRVHGKLLPPAPRSNRSAREPTAPQRTTAPHQALYRRWRAQTFAADRRPGGRSSRRSATRSEPTASRTRSSSSGRAGPARRRSRGSSPRRSTARTCATATRATPARRASRSARAGRSTSSRSTPPPTAASTPSASCASASTTPRPTSGARSTSSTRRTRSRRTPGTRSSSRSRSRPTSSSSCSPRPTPRSSRRRSCRASSASTSGA